jgi:tetratricopeptide (TPR) repeat protein
MSVDLFALWDFGKPEMSEERFRAALAGSSPTDRLILQTQIARTYGLRKDFAKARDILSEVAPQVAVDPDVEARYHLELGRSYCSVAHSKEDLTPEAKELAREHFMKAFHVAKSANLDYLAIDALHMMTTVDSEPQDQLDWNKKAIEYMANSSQPEAKKWEASLHNNLGYALHLAGRYDEALDEFEKSLAARVLAGNARGARVAKWMIAWTLRAKGELRKALGVQLELEKDHDQAGEPDSFVYQELTILYRSLGDDERADHYLHLSQR